MANTSNQWNEEQKRVTLEERFRYNHNRPKQTIRRMLSRKPEMAVPHSSLISAEDERRRTMILCIDSR